MRKSELYDLVSKAQAGDEEAMYQIITVFLPSIRSVRSKAKRDRQEDMEQNIIEMLIKKVSAYDLSQTPDFSTFCRNLIQTADERLPMKNGSTMIEK